MSPQFMEFGPYSYPEYSVGENITYDSTTNPLTNVTGLSVNIANAQKMVNSTAGVDGDLYEDTPMYLAN